MKYMNPTYQAARRCDVTTGAHRGYEKRADDDIDKRCGVCQRPYVFACACLPSLSPSILPRPLHTSEVPPHSVTVQSFRETFGQTGAGPPDVHVHSVDLLAVVQILITIFVSRSTIKHPQAGLSSWYS